MRLRELTLQLKRFVSRRLPSSEVWPAQIAEIDTMDPPSKQLTPRRPSGSGPATATKVRDFLRYSLPWSGCGVCLSVNDYISTLGFNYKQIDR